MDQNEVTAPKAFTFYSNSYFTTKKLGTRCVVRSQGNYLDDVLASQAMLMLACWQSLAARVNSIAIGNVYTHSMSQTLMRLWCLFVMK